MRKFIGDTDSDGFHVVLITKDGSKDFTSREALRTHIREQMPDVDMISDGTSCINEIPELKKEILGTTDEVDMGRLFGILSGKLNTVNRLYNLD